MAKLCCSTRNRQGHCPDDLYAALATLPNQQAVSSRQQAVDGRAFEGSSHREVSHYLFATNPLSKAESMSLQLLDKLEFEPSKCTECGRPNKPSASLCLWCGELLSVNINGKTFP